MTKTIKIEGMHCAHCTGSVKKALESLGGVSAEMDLAKGTAVVTMTSDHTDDALCRAVEDAGFKAVSVA